MDMETLKLIDSLIAEHEQSIAKLKLLKEALRPSSYIDLYPDLE